MPCPSSPLPVTPAALCRVRFAARASERRHKTIAAKVIRQKVDVVK